MYKRRHSSPIEVTEDCKCLSFDDWKTQQANTEDTRRADGEFYDPTTENFPDHAWYDLDQELLRTTISRMCNKLGRPVVDSQIRDAEIADLLKNLDRAKTIPHPSEFNVAVVGNQGVGKSSMINALLNRDLVDASASSSACTAFATIIQHKVDASDDSDVSDLKVSFLDIAEIRDFVEEYIRRYADVYTPDNVPLDNAAVEETDADNESGNEVSDKDVSDADVSDSDFSIISESPASNKRPCRKVSKVVQKGADTAEQFFRIIFNAHWDKSKEAELQTWLDKPDLEDGRFLEHCVKLASEHLAQVQIEEDGSVEYNDVKDSDLPVMRQHATTMWPLIKSVTISTGSVLLRNSIRFMDLPGYGDLNQTRTAVVNEYRRKANFEIVVAKSDRYLSKTDEDRFLHRAIRQHEAKNVFLVLNKKDSCLETPQHQVVRMLKHKTEEPFASIQHRLSKIGNLKGEARKTIQLYRRYLIREAQMADGERECDKIRGKMQRKGVRVFAISSARYFDWLDTSPLEDPPFDPKGTGIPDLRRALLLLPAEASYKTLRYHVFETVTDIEDKVSRILMKFTHDIDVAAIRRYVVEYLPSLSSDLRGLSVTTPNSLLSEAWSDSTKRKIASGMEQQVMNYKTKDDAAYHTFWLMLRNNGIATHGKCTNKNINEDLMQTYKKEIKLWKYNASSKEGNVKQSLQLPVQNTLAELRLRLRAASSDPELKQKVSEALDKLARRIRMVQKELSEQLENATSDNYRRFTTEDDIKCPVAVEMKTAYARINVIRMDERPAHRNGIYKDQRAALIRTVTEDNDGMEPLVNAISVQVKQHQCELWQAVGESFIAAVVGHFEDFAKALAELLENENYMLEAHKLIREHLRQELDGFSKDLALVKRQFNGPEVQHVTKKVRTVQVKEEVLEEA